MKILIIIDTDHHPRPTNGCNTSCRLNSLIHRTDDRCISGTVNTINCKSSVKSEENRHSKLFGDRHFSISTSSKSVNQREISDINHILKRKQTFTLMWRRRIGEAGFEGILLILTSKLAPQISLTQWPFRRDSRGEDWTEAIPIRFTMFLTLSRFLCLGAAEK